MSYQSDGYTSYLKSLGPVKSTRPETEKVGLKETWALIKVGKELPNLGKVCKAVNNNSWAEHYLLPDGRLLEVETDSFGNTKGWIYESIKSWEVYDRPMSSSQYFEF